MRDFWSKIQLRLSIFDKFLCLNMRNKMEITCEKAAFGQHSTCRLCFMPSTYLHSYSIPVVRNYFIYLEFHKGSSLYILQSCSLYVSRLLQSLRLLHMKSISRFN